MKVIAKALTSKQRTKLDDSVFGLIDERKYPMPDKNHAKNAKARAKQQLDEGNLSREDYDKICRKADHILSQSAGWPRDFFTYLVEDKLGDFTFKEMKSATTRGTYKFRNEVEGRVAVVYKDIAGENLRCFVLNLPMGGIDLANEFVNALADKVKGVCKTHHAKFLTSGWREADGPKVTIAHIRGKLYIIVKGI